RSPYTVLGKRYTVRDSAAGYDEVGIASYYGKKFHGRRTSNLEVYDMYAFTAAHKSLPLPSYARVTNLSNGKPVVVRVNDRGPVHDGRIVDLSYAAAVKLGLDRSGTARVDEVGLCPGEGARVDPGVVAGVVAPEPPPAPVEALPPSPMDALVERLPDAATAAPSGVAPAPASLLASGPSAVPVAEAAPASSQPAGVAPGIELQVASFGSRDNAERALARLEAAGITGARLLDADSGGRRVWRLRIGPVAEAAAETLATRISALGFGQPQRVRE